MTETTRFIILSGLCLLLLAPTPGRAEEYKVLADRSIGRSLPQKWLFENIEDRLFRNIDGTKIYLGPGEKGEFFIIGGEDDVTQIKAPSTGKAYLNEAGEFVIWYDRLDKGVHFRGGHELKFKDATQVRFGVSYGANYFYVYENQHGKIYRSDSPEDPITTLIDTFLYKVVETADGGFITLGFRSEGVRQIRHNVIQRWGKVDNTYLVQETREVPRHYQVMDIDPAHPRVLLLNESRLAPQVFDWDLKIDKITPVGVVDGFAIYMNKEFTIGEDMLKMLKSTDR